MHERPWPARCWSLKCIDRLLNDDRVMIAQGHMNRFGMTSHVDRPGGLAGPVKKPTGFMTSSLCIYDELNKRCDSSLGREHVALIAGRAAAAQVYPEELCSAICRGLAKQKLYDSVQSCIHSRVLGKSQIGSMIEAVGLARPVVDWPEHNIDPMHEPDGGCDLLRRKVQDGIQVSAL